MDIVKQKDRNGCAVACVATVIGKSYDEVKKDFICNFIDDGIGFDVMAHYIASSGFDILKKTISFYTKVEFGREELLKPFAPIHIVHVLGKMDLTYAHVVIMDDKGILWCPDGMDDRDIRVSYRIIETIGIWKVI